MADRGRKYDTDWAHFDWTAVIEELNGINPAIDKDIEVRGMSRDMFVDYVQWLHDNRPDLFCIMVMMNKADWNGEKEEMENWKVLWDLYGRDC